MPHTPVDELVPPIAARRALERKLAAATLEAVVLPFPPFMEVWLALVGSSIPLRGERFATLARPSPFVQAFRRRTGTLVEDRGVMLVPGAADNRNAFISVADAAAACVEGVEQPGLAGRIVHVGGPEVLSWRARHLGSPAVVSSTRPG